MNEQLTLLDPCTEYGNGVPDKEQVDRVLVKAYARVAEAWKLENKDAAKMISVSPLVWKQIKMRRWNGSLEGDLLMRIRTAISLYEALHLNFGDDDTANRWITNPNDGPIFSGKEPYKVMLEGGLPAMTETRNYVDALLDGL